MNSLALTFESYTPCTSHEYLTHRGAMNELLNIRQVSVRKDIFNKIDAMLAIESKQRAGLKIRDAVKDVAVEFADHSGFSASRLQAYYRLWRKGGQKQNAKGKKSGPLYQPRDWRMFIPNYSNGNIEAVLKNAPFKEFVRQMFSDTCREDATGAAIQARLLDLWYGGQEIPGFGNIFEWCAKHGRAVPDDNVRRAGDYPEGWSVSHLPRLLPKSKAMRKLIQRGEHAAHDHWGDQLLRDRSRLMPFQLITFDDVRFDIKVIMDIPGRKPQIVYPEAVFGMDVATGLILAKGVLGTYTREDDSDGGKKGTKRGIQQADVRMLMTSILERFGRPVDWQMKVLLENASASLNETDKRVFTKLTGIEFDNTGIVRRKLVESGFVEQGGMPWQKGWIESFFRLLHCRINHLDGTAGRRYDLSNGRLGNVSQKGSKVHYAMRMIEAARDKGVPVAELSLPLLTLSEFHELLDHYVMRLNWRTKHRLQGFEKVYEIEYQPGKYLPHDDPRAAALIEPGMELSARMEAPVERAMRLMRGHRMKPIHPHELMPLAMDKRPVTVRADKVTINNSRYSNDSLIFRDQESAAILAEWNSKKKALLGFMATDASCIHLFTNDDDLAYVCSPRRMKRADLADEAVILRAAGEVDRGRQIIRDEVATLLQPKEDRWAEMREHNADLLGSEVSKSIQGAELVNREKTAKAKDLQATEVGDLQDLISPCENDDPVPAYDEIGDCNILL